MPLSALRASVFVAPLLVAAACAGKIEAVPGDGGTGGSLDGSSSSGSSGSSGSSSGSGSPSGSTGSAGSSSGTVGGNAVCVDIVLADYDTSCKTTDDCISISSGKICIGDCVCGGSSINASGQAQYEAALSSVALARCGCPLEPVPVCVQNHCTTCPNGPDGMPDCGSAKDAGTGICVNVDLTGYDTSCETTSDCVDVTPGLLCTGTCKCGGAAINVDGLSEYTAAVSGITEGECDCLSQSVATCFQNHCIDCRFDACPDGGPSSDAGLSTDGDLGADGG